MVRSSMGLVVVSVLLTAASANAFDGTRKGFILGFSGGISQTSYTQEISGAGALNGKTDRINEFGVGTSFKIGGGFDEQLMLYYVNNLAWFPLDNALGETVTIGSGVGLVGVSYYLRPTTPSGYLLGVIGVSTWEAVFESNSSTSAGFGIGGGFGWEFTPHWSVEVVAEWGNPSDESGGVKLETNAFSVLVMLAGLAY